MFKKKLTDKILSTLAFGLTAMMPLAVLGTVSAAERPQTIVMTDGEVDDMDSFLRFLLYTNEVDVKGIVYTSSCWHYSGDGKGTKFQTHIDFVKNYHPGYHTDLRWCGTDWIHDYIETYRKVYPNLVQHDANYPTADKLQSLVKIGNIAFEGESEQDTEGSDFIKKQLLSEENAPIYFETWGGTNTLARALKSIENTCKGTEQWKAIYKKVSQKVVLYRIMEQDDSYETYIRSHWPDIKVYYNTWQFASLAYIWPQAVPKEQQTYLRGDWMKKNILQGEYGSRYMTYGDGHKLAGDPEDVFGDLAVAHKNGYGQYDLISEGDSPSFLYLIDNGLRSLENPSYGGWSGRLSPSAATKNLWEDNIASYDYNPHTAKRDKYYSQTRWIGDFQNDFAARIAWTQTNDYKKANHAPTDITVKEGLDIPVKPGQKITLHVTAKDPDGNSLSYKWYNYEEAGTYHAPVKVTGKGAQASLTVPENAGSGETIHVICEITDDGTPPLTRYARVILTAE